MSDPTLFFSYASADLREAENLEAWLQAPPRAYTVWRDRSGIPPGAPDYYAPILEGIRSSANFLVQLSPRWLRSRVSAQEIADAHALAKKLVPVVHPAIPRDPTTAEGRARKSELFEALAGSSAKDLTDQLGLAAAARGRPHRRLTHRRSPCHRLRLEAPAQRDRAAARTLAERSGHKCARSRRRIGCTS